MLQDKKHWYDGWFYDKLIAPNQDNIFSVISSMIPQDSSVIDVGCGTGRLEFLIANKCKLITGVDLSSKNIRTAKSNPGNKLFSNIQFIHSDISKLVNHFDSKFDFAVMTYVIHEIPPEKRNKAISSIKELADNIIIGDYLVPRNSGFWNFLNEIVEFAAGRDHYTNFKDFVKRGGLYSLATENKLEIIKEIKNSPNTSHIVLMK